jgi:guanylate kinase
MNLKLEKKGLMIILSSPSGAGKTTLARGLISIDQNSKLSISVTTRKMREGEIHGKDYYFISEKKFFQMKEKNEFLEHAKVFNNYYGTPKDQTIKLLKQKFDVVYDIDWQGALQLMQTSREHVVSIFILPPSLKILEQRLLARNSESKKSFELRFNAAKNEISKCYLYDYVIVNDDLEESLKNIRQIIEAERLKVSRQHIDKIIKNFN